MLENRTGGSIHDNGRIPSTLLSGFTSAEAFEHDYGMPLKNLEDWLVRLDAELKVDRREQESFRAKALADLQVIREGYDIRFAAHDRQLEALERRISGWNGTRGLVAEVQTLKEARDQSDQNTRSNRNFIYALIVAWFGAAATWIIGKLH